MKKEDEVTCIPAGETVQEFYNVKNDVCPICDEKIITPINAVINKGKIYHLTCADEFMNVLK